MKTFVNDDVVWRRHDGLYDIHDGINWRDVTNSAHVLILHQIVVVSTRYQMTDFGSLRLFRKLITARKQSLRRLCFYTCLSFCSQGGGVSFSACWDTHPPFRADTPPPQCMLGDTDNKRAVRILLEYILVYGSFFGGPSSSNHFWSDN